MCPLPGEARTPVQGFPGAAASLQALGLPLGGPCPETPCHGAGRCPPARSSHRSECRSTGLSGDLGGTSSWSPASVCALDTGPGFSPGWTSAAHNGAVLVLFSFLISELGAGIRRASAGASVQAGGMSVPVLNVPPLSCVSVPGRLLSHVPESQRVPHFSAGFLSSQGWGAALPSLVCGHGHCPLQLLSWEAVLRTLGPGWDQRADQLGCDTDRSQVAGREHLCVLSWVKPGLSA